MPLHHGSYCLLDWLDSMLRHHTSSQKRASNEETASSSMHAAYIHSTQQQQQQQQQRARLVRSNLLYIDDMHSPAACMYTCMPIALRTRYCNTTELPSYPSIHAHAAHYYSARHARHIIVAAVRYFQCICLFAIVPMCR